MNRFLVITLSLSLFVLAIWLSDTQQFFVQLWDVPAKIVLLILALQIFNLFVVSFRFWRVLKHFSIALPWQVASRASVSGHVAGLFMISLFGQVMGRNAVLRKCGIEPVVISGIAAYERMILALISGLFCVFGLLWLFGQQYLLEAFDNKIAIQIVIAVILSCLLSFWLGGSKFEKSVLKQAVSWVNGYRLIETIGVTAFGLILTLMCFVAAGSAISGMSASLIDLFAAAAIISFAATIPNTVNGWGVREVAAIFVLDKLGYSTTDAVLVSVMVGVCSMLVILSAIPFTIRSLPKATWRIIQPTNQSSHQINIAKTAGWCFGMATAVAFFFQAHIELSGVKVNINLADPFAILALAAVVQYSITMRRMPEWRYGAFSKALIAITAVLIFGFIRGWLEIGITQWALGGRLFGWIILAGYLSAGYLVVSYAGLHGLRRFSETIISTAVVIIVIQLIVKFLPGNAHTNFEGYSGNRNAFAFQLLIAMLLALGYSRLVVRHGLRVFGSSLILAFILCGLVWSGSRAGLGTGILIIVGAVLFRFANKQVVLFGIVLAVVIWFTIFGVQGVQGVPVQSTYSGDYSDNERWASFVNGVHLWFKSPVFGAGLGVSYQKSLAWSESMQPVVIHNTFLWLLTDFGIVGVLVFISVFYSLYKHAFFNRKQNTGAILLMMLSVFLIFSQVHEIFYQRIFWLVLGAILAKPVLERRNTSEAKT